MLASLGCEVKMSQGCHTIKENKWPTIILVAVIKCQCTAAGAAAELLTALSAEVEITPTSSRGNETPVILIISICALGHEELNLLAFLQTEEVGFGVDGVGRSEVRLTFFFKADIFYLKIT